MLKKFIALTTFVCAQAVHAAQPPHIILINIDDMGWLDLGCQGSTYYETPHIDALASSGMRFTQGYAGAANCAPSRAALISGMASPRTGVYTVGSPARGKAETRKLVPTENTPHLAEDCFTIGDAMQSAGYITATVGKWHVSDDPTTYGFDINIAGNNKGGPYTGGYHSPYKFPNCEQDQPGEYLTDRLTDEAIKIIETHARDDQPLFLYFPYYAVHTPIQANKNHLAHYEAKAGSLGQEHAAYASMIAALDVNIGRLMARLDELSLREKTLVMFTSDNGGHEKYTDQQPLRAGKGSYYEGGIRVPFFASWPGVIPAGEVNQTAVTALDFYPTFCELADVQLPEDKVLDGDSLVRLLRGEADPVFSERTLIYHFPIYLQSYLDDATETRDPLFRTRPGSLIRKGPWKLQQYFEDGDIELFNIENDIGEQQELSQQHPEVAQQLLSELKAWRETMQAPVPTERNPAYQAENN